MSQQQDNSQTIAAISLGLFWTITCLYYQTATQIRKNNHHRHPNNANEEATITADLLQTKETEKPLKSEKRPLPALIPPPPVVAATVVDSPQGGILDANSIFATTNLPPDPKVAAAILLRNQRRRVLSEDNSPGSSSHGGGGSGVNSQFHRFNRSGSHDKIDRIPSFSKSPSYFELSKADDGDDEHHHNPGNPTISTPSHNGQAVPPFASSSNDGQALATLGLEQPMVIAMVGLPARGKSYLVKMIMRYLKWTGFECKMFNVGSYRRQVGLASADANFFDSSNPEFKNIRENLAMAVQDEMYKWLHETKEAKRRVAIFDATNTTKNRRLALAKRARQENVFLLFVESICDDENVLARNYELKLQNDDYKGMDIEKARKDFLSRVKEYEKVYETIVDDEDNQQISYIKLINVGQKVITRNCYGYLPSQVAFYLQNVHIQPRKIYLSYLSEFVEKTFGSENLAGKESGQLTPAGIEYSQNITNYLLYEQEFDLIEKGKEVIILTGTTNIHYQCVQPMKERNFKCFHTPLLNELRGGDLHGLSKEEIRVLFPEEWEKRQNDKLNYRYPGVGGESYLDVIERVRPVIIELERQRRSIFLICHMAVLRCIYAYFMGVPQEEVPFREFQLHRLYELAPGPFGCSCTIIHPHSATDEIAENNTSTGHPNGIVDPNLLPQNGNIIRVSQTQKNIASSLYSNKDSINK